MTNVVARYAAAVPLTTAKHAAGADSHPNLLNRRMAQSAHCFWGRHSMAGVIGRTETMCGA
jgi:hypothetical protein